MRREFWSDVADMATAAWIVSMPFWAPWCAYWVFYFLDALDK